ncbi:hypothetical protein M404DRAFT_479510 [Pisolithus tinctorius Marx 270]|uniref:Uncharacterized protein n=1 Tax=Pisolithus tinctorius Marx 270 TaxID=870435 RepID=A0A0C3NZV4_PISTI|nr:hypothetical protein M404DRAFT_479510 [Pisolithus tinctorius Marx 270]
MAHQPEFSLFRKPQCTTLWQLDPVLWNPDCWLTFIILSPPDHSDGEIQAIASSHGTPGGSGRYASKVIACFCFVFACITSHKSSVTFPALTMGRLNSFRLTSDAFRLPQAANQCKLQSFGHLPSYECVQ